MLANLGSWFQEYIIYDGSSDFGDERVLEEGIDSLAILTRKRYFRSMQQRRGISWPVNQLPDTGLLGAIAGWGSGCWVWPVPRSS